MGHESQKPPTGKFCFLRLSHRFVEIDSAKCCFGAVIPNSGYWSNAGTRVHDLVTRKLTVALYQPMPGLDEPDRERLLPVKVLWSQPTFSQADFQK